MTERSGHHARDGGDALEEENTLQGMSSYTIMYYSNLLTFSHCASFMR